ncbi:MAG: hypothetical protein HY825_16990 [Acidobacteria bacterium]|nr:hypothetical protein [Acidobacteriota bacterium]
MKKLMVVALAVVGLAGSSCIIETSSPCWSNGTCVVGASCDYAGDMDCVSRTSAWWCSPSGYIQSVDCLTDTAAQGGCYGTGTAYAACGEITGCQDARCMCSDNPSFCGAVLNIGGCTGTAVCHP